MLNSVAEATSYFNEVYHFMSSENRRVPVVDADGNPLMPTKASRARRWLRDGKAVIWRNDLKVFAIQLVPEPSARKTQDISVGVDPGSQFTGVAAQSSKDTLFLGHLVLPFKRVRARMEQRALLRRTRRGRRIDRSKPFSERAHRQKRFNNRRQEKLAPSIRANREMELRVVRELRALFPVTTVVYEYIKARTKPGCSFSPVQVGQKRMLEWLSQTGPVKTQFGWETSNLRKHLGLAKAKNKAEQTPDSHANDAVALAASHFMRYTLKQDANSHGHVWKDAVAVTSAPFSIIQRPKLYRRQLHFENPQTGGTRKRKGGTVTPWGFRSGDYVEAEKAGVLVRGWVGGYTEKLKQVSVYSADWKRIGQFVLSKIAPLQRSNGLCVQTN